MSRLHLSFVNNKQRFITFILARSILIFNCMLILYEQFSSDKNTIFFIFHIAAVSRYTIFHINNINNNIEQLDYVSVLNKYWITV